MCDQHWEFFFFWCQGYLRVRILFLKIKIQLLVDYWFIVFNTTFNNISGISWRPVLVVEEVGSTQKEPLNMGKQLVNFITCDCESSAAFL